MNGDNGVVRHLTPVGAELSPRQRRVFDFIRCYVEVHQYPPTVREIRDAIGVSSTSSVVYQLVQLEAKGYLKRVANHPRCLVLVEPDGQAPEVANTG